MLKFFYKTRRPHEVLFNNLLILFLGIKFDWGNYIFVYVGFLIQRFLIIGLNYSGDNRIIIVGDDI